MRVALLITLPFLFASYVAADDRNAVYGTWGTTKQCSRLPIKPGGTVLAEPFVIDSVSLKQGQFWCRLSWGPMETRENGFFTGASASCGEDSARGYFVGMVLADDELTLRWNFPLSIGPLRRCSGS